MRVVPRHLSLLACFSSVIGLSPLTTHSQVLESMISQALSSHPSTQVQRALADSAQAGVEGAHWQFYPTPSVAIEQATASTTDTGYQGDSTVSTLRLQQPLWSGGRLTAGLQKAQASMEASRAALAEVQQQLALRVVQAYGDWSSSHLKLLAYEQSMAVHVRLREQVKRRIEQGVSSDSDLILAVSRLQSVNADISVARAQQDIALSRLGQLLGRQLDASELTPALAVPHAVNIGVQQLLEQAQTLHPAVLKALAQVQLQQAVMAERRAELSPEVYLRAERQYGNYSIANAAPQTRLFIGLSSHFGAGLSSLSNLDGAKAQYQATLAQVQVERSVLNEQVLADHALSSSSHSRLEALNASLAAAIQVSASYDRQFLAGHKTWLDVMNAARELALTEVQLADLQSSQVVVTWRLAIYTQGVAAAVAHN